MTKRLFDMALSSVGLILIALPCALIAALVKLSSAGPVFYRQQRIGRGGRPFWIYKFRTMYVGGGGAQVTVEGDPRITPVGRLLRKCKLDELPQLWNVLRGDMSIVGPRPEVERFVRHYTPEQRRLLEQKPGLAGLSQLVYPHEPELLHAHPNPEEIYLKYLMPRKIAVDLEYESVRTFFSDLRLLGEIALLSLLGRSSRCDRSLQIPPVARPAELCFSPVLDRSDRDVREANDS